MSVYNAYVAQGPPAPPASYYTQPSHPSRSYHHQQQQFSGYHPPHGYDENGFRGMFMQRLGTLTVNSRPIIQDLSMIAQSNPHMARIVVECIERQINMVSFHDPPPSLR